MQLAQVIFAIDDGHDLRTRKKFLRWIDSLIATNKIEYCSQCIGMWEGKLETSYLIRREDFYKYIEQSVWVEKQVCFLHVPGDVRQPCHLQMSDGLFVPLGTMKEGKGKLGWTYVEETETYFNCEV